MVKKNKQKIVKVGKLYGRIAFNVIIGAILLMVLTAILAAMNAGSILIGFLLLLIFGIVTPFIFKIRPGIESTLSLIIGLGIGASLSLIFSGLGINIPTLSPGTTPYPVLIDIALITTSYFASDWIFTMTLGKAIK
jgi:hypothetical protein